MQAATPQTTAPQEGAQPLRLNRDALRHNLTVGTVSVPAAATQGALRALKGLTLDVPRVRPVAPAGDDAARRVILLRPPLTTWEDLPPATRETLVALGAPPLLSPHTLELGFDNLSAEAAVRRSLPPDVAAAGFDVPSSFETVGHLAHVNLHDYQLPYRFLIGDVLLAKNKALRTVVNKTGTIETTFRTFPMEVIAGEDDTQVEVRHCGALFSFDFRAVYWNSRLQHEHERVVKHVLCPAPAQNGVLAPAPVVADMFCGVGPFVVPLAVQEYTRLSGGVPPSSRTPPASSLLRGAAQSIHANDLNPASHAALQANLRRNHVDGLVATYNLDARAFIRRLVAQRVPFSQVLMNLPADGITFCDVFRGLYAGVEPGLPLPTLHVYCFSKTETLREAQVDVMARLLTVLGLPPPGPEDGPAGEGGEEEDVVHCAALPGLRIREVRDVAPKKLMLCASFELPAEVATDVTGGEGAEGAEGECAPPAAKRLKVSDE